MTTETFGDALTRFVAAPVRVQTYKRLVYLLLAFPLGIAYFVGFTTGASMGVGLLITWVGIPILLATLIAATAVSGLEAYLSRTLLDRDIPLPAAFERPSEWSLAAPEGGYLAALWRFLLEPTTWTSVAVVLLKFLYGIVAFVATVTAGSLVLTLLSAPWLYDSPDTSYRIGQYVVDTLPEALAAFGVGVVGLFVALNALNVLADLGGVVTEQLLRVGREATEA
jgi:hypothetical protein